MIFITGIKSGCMLLGNYKAIPLTCFYSSIKHYYVYNVYMSKEYSLAECNQHIPFAIMSLNVIYR